MGKGIFPQQTHSIIQFFSFALIAIGMPSTKVLMSFGLVFAIANWIFEGNFREKWQLIRTNKLLQLLILFYLLLILGLFWSWDIGQGLKDIKSRLPLLVLPLILTTSPPMDVKNVHRLLYLFLASLCVTSVFNVLYFNNVFGSYVADDIRGLSRFASHIRYGLLISMGFGICIWFQISNKKILLGHLLLAFWFTFYTFYSQVLSGTFAYFLIVLLVVFFLLYKVRKWIGFSFLGIVLVGILVVLLQILNLSYENVDCDKLPEYTALGNKYDHDCQVYSEINGKGILVNYSQDEYCIEWRKISTLDPMGLDKRGEILRMTAARYLTALELTKDAKGIQQLTKQDVKNIEDGFTYPNERNEFFMPRLYGVKYQILNNQFPNGHSLLQRIEHWKAASHIIKHNWLYGVGTGGNQKAFDQAYDQLNSPLFPENRLRSHNMYLAYTISYGVFGGLFFLIILGVTFYVAYRTQNLLGVMFLLIACSSFIIEDTLETQLGVTFFGFFLAILMYSNRIKRAN